MIINQTMISEKGNVSHRSYRVIIDRSSNRLIDRGSISSESSFSIFFSLSLDEFVFLSLVIIDRLQRQFDANKDV